MVTVDGTQAEFKFYRPQAEAVFLAGDFNGWDQGQTAMIRGKDGYWFAKVRLPAGEFRFRYCADGEWFTDYAAFGVEPGRFGLDSVVRVEQAPISIGPAAFESESPVAAA